MLAYFDFPPAPSDAPVLDCFAPVANLSMCARRERKHFRRGIIGIWMTISKYESNCKFQARAKRHNISLCRPLVRRHLLAEASQLRPLLGEEEGRIAIADADQEQRLLLRVDLLRSRRELQEKIRRLGAGARRQERENPVRLGLRLRNGSRSRSFEGQLRAGRKKKPDYKC